MALAPLQALSETWRLQCLRGRLQPCTVPEYRHLPRHYSLRSSFMFTRKTCGKVSLRGRPVFRTLIALATSSTPLSNQHFSVGPDGQPVVDLSFASEPIGMPATSGYGWPMFVHNQMIGPQDASQRYTLRRKLGWGMNSSTWLVLDSEDRKYKALKALTAYMTEMDNKNLSWEQDALRAAAYPRPSPHCIHSTHTFTAASPAGEHLFMVTPLFWR